MSDADRVRNEAEAQVAQDQADAKAAASAAAVEAATKTREDAEAAQLENAKDRAVRGVTEDEAVLAEQKVVDDARRAEEDAKKQADEDARGDNRGGMRPGLHDRENRGPF